MHDFHFWLSFLGAPIFLIAITAYVYRPSARAAYREAKRLPFADREYSDKRTH